MDKKIGMLLIDSGIYIGGYLVTYIIGLLLVRLLDSISREIDEDPPDHINPEVWLEILQPGNSKAGLWLGHFERLFFYLAFIFKAVTVIGFWLAFKVASKWETWQNIVKVPDDSLGKFNLKVLERRNWGDRVLQRFLLGTLGNALAGFFGFLFVQVLKNFF